MTECIHGFEAGLCDTCFPTAPVERPRPSRVTTPKAPSVRSSSVKSSSVKSSSVKTGSRPSARAAEEASKPFDLRAVRLYHVTHASNLDGILDAGALLAPATPVFDASSELIRELRTTATAAGHPVSDYVTFSLTPDSATWLEFREGASDPRWSAAARQASATDFVVLGTSLGAVLDAGAGQIVVADGDAAGTFTRFGTDEVAVERVLRRIHADEEALPAAEVLVPDTVPFSVMQVVGVANAPLRDRVREQVGSGMRVAVYPPWFV